MDTPGPVPNLTGAVFAGGQSRRFGRDKALLTVAGETLLARAVRILAMVCTEVIVIGPATRTSVVPDVRVVPDEQPGIGPLGGIATALRAATHDRVLAVATDMPFLYPPLLHYLATYAPTAAVTVPCVEGRVQPLHAVYAHTCLPVMDAQVLQGDYRLNRILPHVTTCIIEEDMIRTFDPHLRSFRNINTEAEWEAIQALLHS